MAELTCLTSSIFRSFCSRGFPQIFWLPKLYLAKLDGFAKLVAPWHIPNVNLDFYFGSLTFVVRLFYAHACKKVSRLPICNEVWKNSNLLKSSWNDACICKTTMIIRSRSILLLRSSHKYKIARSNSGNKKNATVVSHTVEEYNFVFKKTISFLLGEIWKFFFNVAADSIDYEFLGQKLGFCHSV